MEPITAPPEPGWKTNPFWGVVGAGLGLLLLALGALLPPVILARWCLAGSWVCFTVASRILFNHTKHRLRSTGIVSAFIAAFAIWIGLAFKGQANSAAILPVPAQQTVRQADTTAPSAAQKRIAIPAESFGNQQRENKPRKPYDKRPPIGTNVASVTVQPGGVASFGQQGGQTAGTIINNPPGSPNAAVTSYDFNGAKRISGNGGAFQSVTLGDEVPAFQEMLGMEKSAQWADLLSASEKWIKSTPEWLTPRIFAAEAPGYW